MTAEYELFAIRYASRPAMRHEHFIGGDPHDGPMPMDYFVWVAKNADRAVVIDIGFTADSGGKRGRKLDRDPIDSLSLLGVDPASVEDVVLASDVTHFYENFDTYRPFTTAFHVGDMLDAFDTLRAHAADPSLIVPGHDPLVMQRYPAPSPELQGIVVRLDVPPKG